MPGADRRAHNPGSDDVIVAQTRLENNPSLSNSCLVGIHVQYFTIQYSVSAKFKVLSPRSMFVLKFYLFTF